MSGPPKSKIILITGCSSGFGLHSAAHLSSKGYTVIATMRNLEKRHELQDEVDRRNGQVDILQLDVTDQQSIKSAVKQISIKYGHVDILVNNAGCGLGGFFEDLTEDEIRHIMDINFFGVQTVTREVIPLMRQRKQGKIINISSVSGFSTSPGFSAYNASKWALEGFSESLRYELKFFDIDVLLIEPGTYRTKIFSENAHYASNFDNPKSPYYPISQFLRKRVEAHFKDCRKDIKEIPEMIEKLIKSPHPAFRNIPDIESKILYMLRKILPFRIYSFLLRKILFSGFKP